MDVQKLLANSQVLADLLTRGPHLLYAKRSLPGESPAVSIAYNTEPKMHTMHFDNDAERDLLWKGLVETMTRQCTPPCVVLPGILFQPAYLLNLILFADERAYFVVLDFGDGRNLFIGCNTPEKQLGLYNALLDLHGLPPEDLSRFTTVQ